MARIKYYYDTETCKYERIKVSKWDMFLNSLGIFTLSLVLAVIILIISSTYFESPQVSLLKKENKELLLYYNDMQKDLANMDAMLLSLQDRDDNIYRVIFEADPIPSSVRQAGVGGTDRYRALREESLEREDLVFSTMEKIDKLKKQMYIQTKSHDDIEQMARNKSVMMASMPSIQPINNSDLNRLASGYGMRMHPLLKYIRMHAGIDFSAPQGTPIFSTGDGTVEYAGFNGTSGNMVTINHSYGYKTKYLHMSNFAARQGQKVKRGDIIGYVGNTGLSKAPHCHYEVWKDNQHVNPVNFFYNDVTDEEFDKLLELATKENESLG
ncbi:MAG: M23 family metallopeptidase [Cyclobacteriaceae bacterium]|nr:M23 family metallopeptidase [Cyclobacteriaceae bacterium]